MRVYLSRHQAASLRLKDHEEFVRAAFYLGFSILMIKEHVENDSYYHQREITIDTARRLGMNSNDTVEIEDR